MKEYFKHAEEAYPEESCGLLVQGNIYARLKNVAEDPLTDWKFDKEEYVDIEHNEKIIAIIHSHPNGEAIPSEHDIRACNYLKIPYIIVTWPNRGMLTLNPGDLNA